MKKVKKDNILSIIFYLFIVFLPSQFGKTIWLQKLNLLGIRVDYLSIQIFLTDIVILIFLTTSIIQNHLALKIINKKALVFFLFILTQSLWVDSKIIHFIFNLKMFFLYLFFIFIKNLEYKKTTIAKIFITQILILLSLSFFQVFRQGSVGGVFYFLGERRFLISSPGIASEFFLGKKHLRPYATFSHPNTLAGYVLLTLFYIVFFIKPTTTKEKIYKNIFIALSITLIFITQSHIALFTLVLMLAVLFLKNKIKKLSLNKIIKNTLVLSSIIPFVLLLIPSNMVGESVNVRNHLLKQVFNLKPWQYLFGLGWYGDIINLSQNAHLINSKLYLQPIHNSLWLTTISLGLVPILFLIHVFKTKKRLTINFYWFIIFLSVIILSIFDHYLITQQQSRLLLVFLFADFAKTQKYDAN